MRPLPNLQQGKERMTEGEPAVMVTRGRGTEQGAFWSSRTSTESASCRDNFRLKGECFLAEVGKIELS